MGKKKVTERWGDVGVRWGNVLYVCMFQHLEFVCRKWFVSSVFSVAIFGFDLRKKGG
jgi:hypothetical protein